MTEAEKMANEWINMHIEAGGADLRGEMVLIERLIKEVAKRTRDEYPHKWENDDSKEWIKQVRKQFGFSPTGE